MNYVSLDILMSNQLSPFASGYLLDVRLHGLLVWSPVKVKVIWLTLVTFMAGEYSPLASLKGSWWCHGCQSLDTQAAGLA